LVSLFFSYSDNTVSWNNLWLTKQVVSGHVVFWIYKNLRIYQ
jgi:hypothetical protein